MLRTLAGRSSLVAVLFLTGCIDLEKSVTLKNDLSGQATYSLAINMNEVAFLSLDTGSRPKSQGEPSAADLQKMKKSLLRPDGDPEEDPFNFDLRLRSLEKNPPAGLTVRDRKMWTRDPYRGMSFRCDFDRLTSLKGLTFPLLPPQLNPPFGDLRIVDEGKTLLLSDEVVTLFNFPDKQPASQHLPLNWKLAEPHFAGYRFVFKLKSPLPVVASNATRRSGETLTWEVDLPALEKIVDSGKPGLLWARFQK